MSEDLELMLREELDLRLRHIATRPGDLASVTQAGERLRTRRRTTTGILSLVVVAATSAVVLMVGHRGGTDTPANLPVAPAHCLLGSTPSKLPLPRNGRVPSGAIQASLCPTNGARWQPPADALGLGLDSLVTLINSRPAPTHAAFGCLGMPLINDFSITFTYPDGTTSAVYASSCAQTLFTGGHERRDSAGVLEAYVRLLLAQRAAHKPPPTVSPSACFRNDGGAPQSILPTGTTLALRTATVCDYQWTKVGNDAYTFALVGTSTLPPDAVRRVNEGFHDNAVPIEPDYDAGHHLQTIAGTTIWGDAVDLSLLNGQLVRSPTPAEPTMSSLGWELSQADQTRLFDGWKTATNAEDQRAVERLIHRLRHERANFSPVADWSGKRLVLAVPDPASSPWPSVAGDVVGGLHVIVLKAVVSKAEYEHAIATIGRATFVDKNTIQSYDYPTDGSHIIVRVHGLAAMDTDRRAALKATLERVAGVPVELIQAIQVMSAVGNSSR